MAPPASDFPEFYDRIGRFEPVIPPPVKRQNGERWADEVEEEESEPTGGCTEPTSGWTEVSNDTMRRRKISRNTAYSINELLEPVENQPNRFAPIAPIRQIGFTLPEAPVLPRRQLSCLR